MRRLCLALALAAGGPRLASAETLVSQFTPELRLTQFATGLSQPTAAAFLPDGRLVAIGKEGGIRVRPAAGGAWINAGAFDVETTSEQGLIGLAVDPEFSASNRLYFYYSQNGSPVTNRHRVAYALIDPVTSIVDVANKVDILTGIYGPANHDGGGLMFGPDGYLYIGAGDTGCNCNCPPGQADNYFPTCLTNFNGKIMRLGRDGEIPPDAALAGVDTAACGLPGGSYCSTGPNVVPNQSTPQPARAAIYNWGFRNPWRFVFDEQTGFLWVGDVGEITWEEITISTGPNQHHGWPFREGFHGLAVTRCGESTPMSGNCKEPAYEYNHSESPSGGQGSVSAGAFSNDCSWPAPWRGRFWFGDYNKSRIWTLTPNAARDGIEAGSRTTIVTSASGPVHFFNGPDHAIYFVAIAGGDIWRIAPLNPASCDGDGGVLNPDATADSGQAAMDAAIIDTGDPDAGAPVPDAGAGADAVVDAASMDAAGIDADASTDADATSDAGAIEPAPRDDCSCRAATTLAGTPLLLLALVGFATSLRRRKA